MNDDPLAPEVVDAVVAHMNADHAEDCLAICRRHGAPEWAERAGMTGYDADGADFEVAGAGRSQLVRAPWTAPLRTRADVRHELVRMTEGDDTDRDVDPDPDTVM